jgi:iron complex transport system substrate-binding protein
MKASNVEPVRICSLQPGATEIVYALGLQDQLFGVTSRCDFPPDALNRPVIVHSVFDGKHPTSGEINRTIAQLFGVGRKVSEIDLPALAAAAPDLLLTQAICEV